ncbi:dimethylamine monooxygenase subunit DmmA family protein [Falsirhodobacter sp. alg1]|uniref:dimethylamine monooxygenase subunit DmmA family protein n=1 Tax=Falsirhodobacter sp. alg1 TaxID=1472418 RepID=UPI0005ED65CE|nr:dimethylamine monooxygenase subunit DmmA family protein [Falsirhodobacter sp. alg1]
MAGTAFTPSILSRPVYAGLVSRGATPAIMLAEGEGALALMALADHDPAVMGHAHIIHIPAGTGHGAALQALGPAMYHEGPTLPAVLPRLRKALGDAHMGTALYIAGTEGVIGQVTAEALAAGVAAGAISTEHHGGAARRMQCVHCKGITEDVVTDPFICSHCGLSLFVRDHFSRRLGAFQGVCVDAETPGQIPAMQEIRP